jgi:DNA-binding NarL/FixJ family response regulator
VLERCSSTSETILMSFICKHTLNSQHLFGDNQSSDRMDEIKEAMEAVVGGRKYEVLLLRSQGKSMAEIAMLLSISKSTVQNYYRQAIRQVRQVLGIEKSDPAKRKSRKAETQVSEPSVPV